MAGYSLIRGIAMKPGWTVFLALLGLATTAWGAVTEAMGPEESDESAESYEDSADMTFCMTQENVTESEMKDFLVLKKTQDDNEALKKTILCFLKRIEFFDGTTWNMKVIAESVDDTPDLLDAIKKCLEKDDKTLEPHERTYRAQKCVLEADNSDT